MAVFKFNSVKEIDICAIITLCYIYAFITLI